MKVTLVKCAQLLLFMLSLSIYVMVLFNCSIPISQAALVWRRVTRKCFVIELMCVTTFLLRHFGRILSRGDFEIVSRFLIDLGTIFYLIISLVFQLLLFEAFLIIILLLFEQACAATSHLS